MAKLSEDSTLATMRGKVGGFVVSSNTSGGYVRPWFMPRVPRTPEQSAWAAKFAGWAQGWKALTEEQAAAWDAASDDPAWTRSDWFGQPYQPSGYNLWIMVCSIRDSVGLEPTVTAPTSASPEGAFVCTLGLRTFENPSTCNLYVNPVPPATGVYWQVEIAPFNGPWSAKRNKPFRPFAAGEFEYPGTYDLSAEYGARVGRIYAWSGVWYRWRALTSDCVPGVWQTGSAHAAAE